MGNKTKFWIFILLLMFTFGFSNESMAQSDIKVIQSIGSVPICGQDITSARKDALSGAMVSSVLRVIEELIPSENIVSNFQKLDEIFFRNIENYISEYRVLSENTSAKTHLALVETTVFTEKIRENLISLGAISVKTDLPKVVFFISEQNIGDVLPLFWWGEEPTFIEANSEKAMAKAFTDKGFSVLDHKGLLLFHPESDNDLKSADLNNPYLTIEQAIKAGRHLNADIVVVGTAIASTVPNIMGESTRSFKADLSARAVRVDSGKQIASVDQNTVAVAPDNITGGKNALSNAGTIAGKDLVSQITQSWQQSETAPGQIEILVKGTGNLNTFVSFRKSLSEIPNVQNIRIKETLPDQAILVLNYNHSARDLAESLMQRSFDTFGINISETIHGHISLELLPAPKAP